MKRQNKFTYLYVVQGNYSATYGWEDLDEIAKHESFTITENGKDKTLTSYQYARYLLKEYRLGTPAASHRIISRRVLNPAAN